MAQALNWGNMAEEEPLQSREALADEEFAATMAKIDANNQGIQLEQDDRSSVLEHDFPPLTKQARSSGTSVPSHFLTDSLSSSPQTRVEDSSQNTTLAGSLCMCCFTHSN